MKKFVTLALLCTMLTSLFAQDYSQAEVDALKLFFKQASAETGKTNAEQLGIADVDNWNPATSATPMPYSVWKPILPEYPK